MVIGMDCEGLRLIKLKLRQTRRRNVKLSEEETADLEALLDKQDCDTCDAISECRRLHGELTNKMPIPPLDRKVVYHTDGSGCVQGTLRSSSVQLKTLTIKELVI